MPASYPNALFTRGPVPATMPELPSHRDQHDTLNAEVAAIQAKLRTTQAWCGVEHFATTAQRDALYTSPATGVVCTVGADLQIYNGSAWVVLSSADTGWLPLTLTNGWTAVGYGHPVPAYRRVGLTVQFRGAVQGGTVGQAIATIAQVADRPLTRLIFPAVGVSAGYFVVEPSGVINREAGDTSWFSLATARYFVG